MKKFKYALNIDLLESRLSEIEISLTRLDELKKEYSSQEKFLPMNQKAMRRKPMDEWLSVQGSALWNPVWAESP